MPEVEALAANKVLSYDYESSNSAPAAGIANQRVNDRSLLGLNLTGQSAADNTTYLSALKAGGYLGINGIKFQITGVTVAAGVATLTIIPPRTAPPFGVTNLLFQDSPFPLFVPIVPPPVFGVGGGAPPNFPPPTPPPIGAIPLGVLVGPAVAAAAVPPSVAGFPLLQFKTGTAIAPTAASWIPQFTTTFPVPTIVFTNTLMIGAAVPPHTNSTLCIVLNGWGPSVPAGAPTTPGSDGRLPRPALAAMLAAKPALVDEVAEPPPEEPPAPTRRTRRR